MINTPIPMWANIFDAIELGNEKILFNIFERPELYKNCKIFIDDEKIVKIAKDNAKKTIKISLWR